MAEHLTEEEQLEALKRWWKENGQSTIIGVLLAVSGYLGWTFWQDSQRSSAEAASAIYQDLIDAVSVQPGEELSDEKRTSVNHLADQRVDVGKQLILDVHPAAQRGHFHDLLRRG